MKRMQVISLLTVLVLALSTLLGCSGGIPSERAEETVYGFLDALAVGDYTSAREYLHPHFSTDPEHIVSDTRDKLGIDLTDGIGERRINSREISVYASDVGGSRYTLGILAKCSGKRINLEITVVENEQGYGIYNVRVN